MTLVPDETLVAIIARTDVETRVHDREVVPLPCETESVA